MRLQSAIPTLSMKAERKWFMSSYAFKLASESPWEALTGPTGEAPTNQDKVDVHMEGSQTSLLVSVYLVLCSLQSKELVILSYIHRSQIVHVCLLPPSFLSLFLLLMFLSLLYRTSLYLHYHSLSLSFTPSHIPSFQNTLCLCVLCS